MAVEETKMNCGCACPSVDSSRRKAMGGMLTLALAPLVATPAVAAADAAARGTKPQEGDRLAFMMGDNKGKEVKLADVQLGKEPVLAYPMDPVTGKVLESRVNLIVMIRLKDADISAKVKPHAADGVVAYSALCTHYGCPITNIDPTLKQVVCNCHGSVFDAGNRGVVTAGPATRRLPLLPLKVVDGALVIAGKFDGPLGPPT